MTQTQVNFYQAVTLGVSHRTAHGGILLKASVLPASEPSNGLQLQLFGNIHGCYLCETVACTLDTVRADLNSIWLL